MNNTEIIKAFKAKTLTEEFLVENILTELASSLYVYMCFMEKQNRKKEAELIKTLRDIIFNLRCKTDKTYKEISEILKMVTMRLRIQVTMLEEHPENAWEAHLFASPVNDLLMAEHFFTDNQ